MTVRTYICSISSDSSYGAEYKLCTRNAVKIGTIYGRCENGETVTVRTHSGYIVSKAIWSPEKKKYIRVNV